MFYNADLSFDFHLILFLRFRNIVFKISNYHSNNDLNLLPFLTACGVGWARFDGQCYKWLRLGEREYDVPFERAQEACANTMPGSTLPIITSQEQNDFVMRLVLFTE